MSRHRTTPLTPLSHDRHALIAAGLAVDLTALAVVATVGAFHGYQQTFATVTVWRVAHPWSLLPSVVVGCLLMWRGRRG